MVLGAAWAGTVWYRSLEDGPPAESPTAASGMSGRIRFENRQPRSGIDFVLQNGSTEEKPVIDTMLGGVALFDYDNDGFLDIYFTNGASIPELRKDDESFFNRLYRNQRDGTFEDVTLQAGVAGVGYSMGAAAADFNNDGFTDLYVTGVNANTLYQNRGDGTFQDVTGQARVTGRNAGGSKPWSVAAAWLDYDNDGDLDLFVVNYLDWSWEKNEVCGDPGKRLSCSPVMYGGLANMLFRNEGDGRFTDVSQAAGIAEHIGKGMGVAVADYDGDGFVDVFVGNDSERNFLFRNMDGKRFAEVGVQTGVAFTEDGVPVSSMGVEFRDLNNDGLPDLTITALANETFPLFLNRGQGLFLDATYASGMGLAAYTMSGWGNGAYDFDNDGWKDIFTANSHVSENVGHYRHHEYRLPNSVWRNEGDGTFQNVTGRAGAALEAAAPHRGAAFGDLDNDGKVDVVVTAIGEKPEVLFNTSQPDHHWIVLDLAGNASNRDGIGARIKLTSASGLTQYNHATISVGYASSSDKRVYFGLGEADRIRQIEIRWPSGVTQTLEDVAADQILIVNEP